MCDILYILQLVASNTWKYTDRLPHFGTGIIENDTHR